MNILAPEQQPMIIGASFGGGFFAGQLRIGNDLFGLIVAPKAAGARAEARWNKSTKRIDGAGSFCDGLANTIAMDGAGSGLATWARDLRIADYDDWYLPSRDELELLYRHFKPTAAENWVHRNGDNPSSLPTGYPYTAASPGQTGVDVFRLGGLEAFDEAWYWTSTQCASGPDYAWGQGFNDGYQDDTRKNYVLRARAVRRTPI